MKKTILIMMILLVSSAYAYNVDWTIDANMPFGANTYRCLDDVCSPSTIQFVEEEHGTSVQLNFEDTQDADNPDFYSVFLYPDDACHVPTSFHVELAQSSTPYNELSFGKQAADYCGSNVEGIQLSKNNVLPGETVTVSADLQSAWGFADPVVDFVPEELKSYYDSIVDVRFYVNGVEMEHEQISIDHEDQWITESFDFTPTKPGNYVLKIATKMDNDCKCEGSNLKFREILLVVEEPPLACIEGHKKDNVNIGLPGWTIKAEKGGVTHTATTDGTGYYMFDNLEPGTYTVSEVMQSGWEVADGHQISYEVEANPGSTCAYQLFVNQQEQSYCGDGVVDAGEQCDDGNDDNYDSCRNDCTLPYCGDGMLDSGEECDYAASPGEPGYNEFCTNECTIEQMGCVEGVKRDDSHVGLEGWTIHAKMEGELDSSSQVEVSGADGTFRFDGLEPGTYVFWEEMQQGWEPVTAERFQAYVPSGESCTQIAFKNRQVTQTYCGDGVTQRPNDDGFYEECDDGNEDDFDSCRNDCTLPYCGDGVLDSGEECDYAAEPGEPGYSEYCTAECTTEVPLGCFEGHKKDNVGIGLPSWEIKLEGEAYSASRTTDGTGYYMFDNLEPGTYTVSEVMQSGWEVADGHETSYEVQVESGESCGYQLFVNQQVEQSYCGDGVVDAGEQCDDGNDDDTDSCRNDCTLPYCGDGMLDSGEECDYAASPGEEGYSEYCTPQCTLEYEELGCVEGYKRDEQQKGLEGWRIQLEAVDSDFNLLATTDSTGHYRFDDLPFGKYEVFEYMQSGWEVAPGSSDWYIVQVDSAECEQVEFVNREAVQPYCGDGVVDTGEQCDDGNSDDLDSCRNDCTLPYCGDGMLDSGEECDYAASPGEPGYSESCTEQCTVEEEITCVEALEQNLLRGYIIDDKAYVTNDASTDFMVTLASYSKVDNLVQTQELYDYKTDTVFAQSTLELQVDLPECPYQIDLVCGEVIEDFSEIFYEERKIDWKHGNADLPYCGESYCGDGIVDSGEACDDGNEDDFDSCRNDCTLPYCGDGVLDSGEECDYAASSGEPGYDESCTEQCVIENEELGCVEGVKRDDSHIGLEGWTIHAKVASEDDSTSATAISSEDGSFGFYGIEPGLYEFWEEMQEGWEPVTSDRFQAEVFAGEICTEIAFKNRQTVQNYCGDGVVDSGEQCDDGNNDDTDSCRNDCTLPYCGDGMLDSGEECDYAASPGEEGYSEYCTSQCDVEQSSGDYCARSPGFWQNGPEHIADTCNDGTTSLYREVNACAYRFRFDSGEELCDYYDTLKGYNTDFHLLADCLDLAAGFLAEDDLVTISYNAQCDAQSTTVSVEEAIDILEHCGGSEGKDIAESIYSQREGECTMEGYDNSQREDSQREKSQETVRPSGDSDRDGIPDSEDNCPNIRNSNQIDRDGNGVGDRCDDDRDGDGYSQDVDCNDWNRKINPGAKEIRNNGMDDDCNPDTTDKKYNTWSSSKGALRVDADVQNYLSGGDTAYVDVSLDNTGYHDLDDIEITVSISDYGIFESATVHDLYEGRSKTENFRIDLPQDAHGYTYLRIRVKHEEYSRTLYRELLID